MSTIDKMGGIVAAKPESGLHKVFTVPVTVDFAGVVNADVLQVIPALKGWKCLGVAKTQVVACDGTTPVADMGVTGGDVDGFMDGVALDSTAGAIVDGAGALATGGGYLFTADDTIDLLISVTGTITVGSAKFVAYFVDLN